MTSEFHPDTETYFNDLSLKMERIDKASQKIEDYTFEAAYCAMLGASGALLSKFVDVTSDRRVPIANLVSDIYLCTGYLGFAGCAGAIGMAASQKIARRRILNHES